MRFFSFHTLIAPFLFVAILLSLPKTTSEAIRMYICQTWISIWNAQQARNSQEKALSSEAKLPFSMIDKTTHFSAEAEIIENLRLKEALKRLEHLIHSCLPQIAFRSEESSPYLVPTQTILRSSKSWDHTLWINVGTEHNVPLLQPIIAHNSPVLYQDCIVGVIDYVGKQCSRVRLITDSRLPVAVRVMRSDEGSSHLLSSIEEVLDYLQDKRKINRADSESLEITIRYLHHLQKAQEKKNQQYYLAKGELGGAVEPICSRTEILLRGSGFNYDFEDTYSPPKDLRTGLPYALSSKEKNLVACPLVQVGDLIITSGMDGIFPEGLKVGKVHSVEPLKEGSSSIQILISPYLNNGGDLKDLFVLAPQGPFSEDLINANKPIWQK